MRENKDLFITGPTGTGKSYLATAIGYKACQDGFRVMYSNTARLMSLLKIAKAKGTVINDLKRIERCDLLILDDFGMQSFDSQSRGILMDVIEDRHQKRSTMITSQVPVKGWHDVIGENRRQAECHQTCLNGRGAKEENKVKTVADAVLDRIVHRSLRVELYGESIRKRKTNKTGNPYG